jgi:hypothetical protein
MKKNINLFLSLALLALVITGCQPEGFQTPKGGKARSVTVKEAFFDSGSQTMQLTVKDNAQLQLNVVTIPANIPVSIHNSNPELFEITPDGLLKPKGIGIFGKGAITVSANDGSGLSTRFVVSVTDHLVTATSIDVASDGLAPKVQYNGKTFDLGKHVSLSPADAWEPIITYESENPAVATVDPNTGVITSGSTVDVKTNIIITYKNNFNTTVLTRKVEIEILLRVGQYTDIEDRSKWKVEMTMGALAQDGATGNVPAHLFDGNTSTFLSISKPNTLVAMATPPTFVVDMAEKKTINYIKWAHRGNNDAQGLRVYAVKLWGSDDGTTFTPILPKAVFAPVGQEDKNAALFWVPTNNKYNYTSLGAGQDYNFYRLTEFAEDRAVRYIKVELTVNNLNYGDSTSQSVYYEHPGYPLAERNNNNAMEQVSEFGAGHVVWQQ